MKQKRWVLLLTSFFVVLSLLVGCSGAELGFYNLSKEVQEVSRTKPVESTGEISLKLNALSSEITDGMTKEEIKVLDTIKNILNEYSITYKSKADVQKQIAEAQIYFKNQKDNKEDLIMSVVRKNQKTYVQIDKYIAFIKDAVKELSSEEAAEVNAKLDQLFGEVKYISMTDDELIDFFTRAGQVSTGIGMDNPLLAQQQQMNINTIKNSLDPVKVAQQQKLIEKFTDGLVQKVYNKYEMNIVKQDQNKYTLSLETKNVTDLAVSFLNYTIDNAEGLGAYLKEFTGGLKQEEIVMVQGLLPMIPLDKQTVDAGIDAALREITPNKEEVKKQVETSKMMADGILKSTLGNSKIEVSYEKKAGDHYEIVQNIRLDVNEPMSGKKILDATLTVKNGIKVIPSFDVTVPTEGMISFTELENKMPIILQVQVDHNIYTMNKGFIPVSGTIDVKLFEGRTYLPVRQIAEAFDEKVVWDAKVQKVYIEKEGKSIPLDGKLIGNKSYVKIREFEKLGYTVEWDEETHTASIIKLK